MSIEAMNWALSQTAGSPAAKSVLLVLANRCDHKGKCWPGIEGIAAQTELGERTVIRHIQNLQSAGLICVTHRGGTGEGRRSNVYQLHIGAKCQFCTLGQSANGAGQSAIDDRLSATLTPEPINKPSKNRQRERRATRIPDDFELTDERRLVAEAETLPAERVFTKFVAYWKSASGAKARKKDWDATWRVWCMNEADRFARSGGPQRKTQYEQMMESIDASTED